jgi:hypothetical protein
MLLMGLGPVRRLGGKTAALATAGMQRDPSALVEEGDGLTTQLHLHGLLSQRIRHAVKVPIDLDMVVNIDFGRSLLGALIAPGRQRLERRSVQRFK